jgi:hypothetical protein
MMTEQAGQPGQETGAAQEKEEQSPQTPLEGKFAGKSATEIAAAYEELERKLGEQGQQLGQLKSVNEQMTTYLQQMAQQAQAQRPPEHQDKPAGWDWDKPDYSAAQIADKTVDKKLGEFYKVIRTQQAQTAAGFAKMVAKQQYPSLFEGDVEREVEMAMNNALRSGTVDPAIVENPNMWVNMAYVLKGAKSNYSLQGGVSPVSPQYGETPAGAKARMVEEGGEPLDLEPEHLQAIKKVAEATGTKEDDLIKEFKQERKKARR